MIIANDLKKGMVVVWEGKKCRVTEVDRHTGAGRAGTMDIVTLVDLGSGHPHTVRMNPADRLEEIPTARRKMQYLYKDEDFFHFMDAASFDQIPVPKEVLGRDGAILLENETYDVDFAGEEPLGVHFQGQMDLRVVSTPAGLHDKESSTLKEATLENGLVVMVPQFVEAGEVIRIDLQKRAYLERVRKK
jgi:elongation factor P